MKARLRWIWTSRGKYTESKLEKLENTALLWLEAHPEAPDDWRIDVIAILLDHQDNLRIKAFCKYDLMSTEVKKPLIIILGPTAVGKTTAAMVLARRFGGEIVSADSRQLYRGMNIGTAKPTADEMNLVPHHLIDVADPDQVWSLGIYQRENLSSDRSDSWAG